MSKTRPIQLSIVVLMVALFLHTGADAADDPVYTFILTADSLAQNESDELLASYVGEHSVLVGAAVGKLINWAFEVGEEGDKDGEKENLDFAELVARLYQEQTGSGAPFELINTYKSWSPQQRTLRGEAIALEAEAFGARRESEFGRAVELFQTALKNYGAIDDRHSLAVTLGRIGGTYFRWSDWDSALTYYQKALVARREVENHNLEGSTLNGLGSANFQKGNYDTAADYYKKAMDVRRQIGDLGRWAQSLNYLGNVYYYTNRFVDAKNTYEEALPILEEAGNAEYLVENLINIANIYTVMSRMERANAAYRRAIQICESLDNPQTEATCRYNMADNLRMTGRYREALQQLDIALSLLDPESNPEKIADVYGFRGLTYLNMGELARAREDLLAYLQRSETLDDRAYQIDALVHLGSLHLELGSFEAGLNVAEKAIALAKESEYPGLFRNASVVAGHLEKALGNLEGASTHFENALEQDRSGGASANLMDDGLNISNIKAELGKTDEARAGFEDVWSLARDSDRAELESVFYMGMAHTYEQENPDSSAVYYDRALALLEQSRASVGGAEVLSGFLSGERRRWYEEIARFYASVDDEDRRDEWMARAFRTVEQAKARGLLDLLENQLLAKNSEAEEAVLDDLYRVTADTLANDEEYLKLETRYLELREQRISESVGALKSGGVVVGLAEVQKSLPRGTALLEYALGDTVSLLWAIDRKGYDFYKISNRGELRTDVERLKDALAQPGQGDAVLRKTARDLFCALVAPAENRISKAKNLIIVPDGVLFEVPFELFLTGEPDANAGWEGQSFLARSFATIYSPSASIYVKLLQANKRMKKRNYALDLLALGDPDFSSLTRKPGTTGDPLEPLPHTRSEILNISSPIKEKRKGILLGEQASEAQLKAELRKGTPRILHLATHGLVDPLEPVSSSVVLCPSPDPGDDGYLHTLEILSLPLEVGLVVLSACETATGKVGRGEGVVGLSRAFVASGAGGVVASLWAVSDKSTAELMTKFYAKMLGKKKPAGQALQDARLAMIENPDYAHPFYWSPFVVIGTEKSPW